MKVVIVGAGEVGYHVIGALYRENVDIVAIDLNQAVLDQLKSEFNITTLLGNATDSDLLERAGAKEADMFLAVTSKTPASLVTLPPLKSTSTRRPLHPGKLSCSLLRFVMAKSFFPEGLFL